MLYAYRYEHRPVLTQAKVGRWLGLTQGQVSRLERQELPAYDLSKLDQWARSLRIPERHLWFRLTETPAAVVPRDRPPMPGGTGFTWFSAAAKTTATERVVIPADVAVLRAMTQTFRKLDNRFGGGHARSTVSSYLFSEAAPLLRAGRFTDDVRLDLFSAVAELNQLAGWMAYDVGDADSGRKHLRQALQLCQGIGDDALSAEMLAGMSHHAAFFRSPAVATDLARAAREEAGRSGVAALVSEAAVMEAHGLALQSDESGCVAALTDAERAFATSDGVERPAWLSYFDEAYLAAKFAHCFRDLGQPVEAEIYARRSLVMSEGYIRGRLFNTALLASILADQKRVEEACQLGSVAVRMVGSLQSVRSVAYLHDIARRLAPYCCEPVVQSFYAEMTTAGIPLG